MLRLGWFSTGRDEAALDLLKTVWEAIQGGEIEAKISFVFCNRKPGEAAASDAFIRLVGDYGVPLITFSTRRFQREKGISTPHDSSPRAPWRLEHDREVMRLLQGYSPDLCLLAGYMHIVGEEMCQRYNMINLHPAAPGGPTGSWQQVIWRLMEDRASRSGVMMHLATPELDRGPVVTYCTYSLRGEPFDGYWREMEGVSIPEIKRQEGEANPLFRLIRQHGLAREFPLILATIRAFAQGRVRIEEGKVLDSRGNPVAGYDLTEDIESQLRDKATP
ncbi:MAG: phosphoglycerate transporter [Chloroflexi bacterium]|nr:phosphoglycerate transporter [Chloroflexota bacterium]